MPDEMAAQFYPKTGARLPFPWMEKQSRSTTGMKHMGSPLHIIERSDCDLALPWRRNGFQQKTTNSAEEAAGKNDIEGADCCGCTKLPEKLRR